MSSLGSPNSFFLAGKKAYEVERSLRFNDGDSANLNRTPSSAGNRKTWTLSVWVKRTTIDANQRIFTAYDGSNTNAECNIQFQSDGKLQINNNNTSSNTDTNLKTDRLFRDPSAWYHIVIATDMTQGTAANRVNLYVNGVQETSFSTESYGTQNVDWWFNNNSPQTIGIRHTTGERPFDGYMAEINLIDGSQLTPASFGETNVLTGQWNPKKYVGSYGTNGFYLNFSDNSGTTATTLGKDSSGNGNNFTPNNFSVAAGAGNDSLEDTPTNNFCTLNSIKKDGQTTLSNGNLQASGSQTSTYNINTQGTFAQSSGKWYYEVEFTSGSGSCAVGWARTTLRSSDNPTTGGGILYRPTNGDYVDLAANNPTTPPTTSTGTVIQVAIDFDAGKIWFGSGGTYFNSGDPSAGSNEAMTFTGGSELLAPVVRTMAATFNFNFGQRAFSYTVPTGYQSLCSANLPDPTILLPNKHFDTLLYSGTGSSNSITGLNFAPDWVWAKRRNASGNHHLLIDQIRGGNASLMSNNTDAENTNANRSMTFNSNGVTWNSDTGNANASGGTYVLWNWDAGETDGKTYTVTVVSDSGNKYRFDGFGTSAVTLDLAEGGTYIFNYPSAHPLKFSTTADGTHGGGSEYTTGVTHNSSTQVTIVVAASAPQLFYYCSIHSGMGGAVNTNSTLGSSNFDGSGQATVKANTTAGFSIVTYTGNATGSFTSGVWQSIGHGLGVAPQVIIMKSRSYGDNDTNWATYHHELTDANTDYLRLNTSDARTQTDVNYMGSTLPTSSVFSLGYNFTTNKASETFVGYVFSEVAGYSKFGKYTGNGNADGTFVFTGFRPAWVMTKNTDTGTWWFIYDVKRETYNPMRTIFGANSTDAEYYDNAYKIDILSNGFKARGTQPEINKSGDTIIYLAFAESPFKNARAR